LPLPDGTADVVVAGAHGQLGRAVADRFSQAGFHVARGSHSELDLLDPLASRRVIRQLEPTVVIDCTQMPARLGNRTPIAEAARNLAVAAKGVGALSIYLSCAEVFDGYSDEPYLESSVARPTTTLGVAKLAAEEAVAGANDLHALIRTSWLF
jgi:dTDP-4-dehydrorhamnose reductase